MSRLSNLPNEILHHLFSGLYPPAAFQSYAQTLASEDYGQYLDQIQEADNIMTHIATAYPELRGITG